MREVFFDPSLRLSVSLSDETVIDLKVISHRFGLRDLFIVTCANVSAHKLVIDRAPRDIHVGNLPPTFLCCLSVIACKLFHRSTSPCQPAQTCGLELMLQKPGIETNEPGGGYDSQKVALLYIMRCADLYSIDRPRSERELDLKIQRITD